MPGLARRVISPPIRRSKWPETCGARGTWLVSLSWRVLPSTQLKFGHRCQRLNGFRASASAIGILTANFDQIIARCRTQRHGQEQADQKIGDLLGFAGCV